MGVAPVTVSDYAVHSYFWEFIDHWQTLIAGFLAVGAAGWTVWATIKSANREVAAANLQVDEARRTERRQLAREGYAFMAMVDAAMVVMLEEIERAGTMCPRPPPGQMGTHSSPRAYQARLGITRTGFTDVLSAMVRQGGTLAAPFMRLDREALTFRSRTFPMPTEVTRACNKVSTRNSSNSKQWRPRYDPTPPRGCRLVWTC